MIPLALCASDSMSSRISVSERHSAQSMLPDHQRASHGALNHTSVTAHQRSDRRLILAHRERTVTVPGDPAQREHLPLEGGGETLHLGSRRQETDSFPATLITVLRGFPYNVPTSKRNALTPSTRRLHFARTPAFDGSAPKRPGNCRASESGGIGRRPRLGNRGINATRIARNAPCG